MERLTIKDRVFRKIKVSDKDFTNDQLNILCDFISSCIDQKFSFSKTFRRTKTLYDIIKNNTDDYMALYEKYYNTNSQYEKLIIREGQKAKDALETKYKKRPSPKKIVSNFTKEYWMERKGFSEKDAIIAVQNIQSSNGKKAHLKPRNSREIFPGCIEYWKKRGYNEDDSEKKKTEYNNKNSHTLDNLISKYGKEIGIKKRKEYTEKRQNTTFERYGTKTVYVKVSKESLKFFIPLYKKLRRCGMTKDDFYWGIKGSKEFVTHYKGNNYFFDFTIKSKKIVIEYNNNFWHVKEESENWSNPFRTKDQSLLNDKTKKEAMIDRGFDVYYVWNTDNFEQKIEELFECIMRKKL